MREHRWVVVVGVVAVLGGLASPAVYAFSGESDGAEVGVEGVVERLSDVTSGSDVAVRLPSGDRVPLTDGGVTESGDRVRVTVPVPEDVVDDIRAGRPVDGAEEHTVTRSDLRASTLRPAPSDSPLSHAVAEHIAEEGTPVASRETVVLAHAEVAAGAAASAVHTVTVAIVRPKGVSGTVATAAQVAAQVKGADTYWREQSGGKVALQLGTVSKPYASAYTCRDSAFAVWTEAARATGFREGPDKHLVVVLPRTAVDAGCSYGLASMGHDLSSGGVAYVSDTAWPVLAHEFGHNLGLAHAKGLRCRSTSDADLARLPGGCRVDEYGDPFDVMSASSQGNAGSLSMPQAVRVGFAGTGDFVDVAGGSRTVTLRPVSGLSGVRAARVRDPRSGAVYWVEYRDRGGRDAGLYMPMTAGVRVLREEAATTGQWPGTVALDASPTGSGSDADWSLPAGSTFASYGGGVGFSVGAVGRGAATVTVNVAASGRAVAGTPGKVTRRSAAAVGRPSPRPTATTVRVATPSLSVARNGRVTWRSPGRAVRYDARIRRVVGRSTGKEQVWYSKTGRTSALLKGTRGTTVQIRVRATAGGTSSTWSRWQAVTFR